MTEVSAKNALHKAVVKLYSNGTAIGINPNGGYLRGSNSPVDFMILFRNNTDFELYRNGGGPVHTDSPDSEVAVQRGNDQGNPGENVYFFSYDRYESGNRIDMSQVPLSVFNNRTVFIKNHYGRSMGLQYGANNIDNNSVYRGWDIGGNQGRVTFSITTMSQYHKIYTSMMASQDMQAKCCTNQFNGTDADSVISKQVCQDFSFTKGSDSCDNVMNNFCPTHLDDPYCSCYMDRNTVINDPALLAKYPLSKYTTQPQCWNDSCLSGGYKNAGLRSAPSCPSITVCTQDIDKISGANNVLRNVLLTQNCGSTGTNTTAGTAGTTGSAPGTPGTAGTAGNTTLDTTTSGEGISDKFLKAKIFVQAHIWVFLIGFAVIIPLLFMYFNLGTNDSSNSTIVASPVENPALSTSPTVSPTVSPVVSPVVASPVVSPVTSSVV